jgi:Histidine kinase-, DNA gyrase B-, and HSP90-like ATPase
MSQSLGIITEPLETITGMVSPRIVSKVDRFFRNDDTGIFNEVLQNARRAGATRVDISMEQRAREECLITVEDDGCGISNFQQLLYLGESGWNEKTEAQEDPAGMGFFSLCRSHIHVSSGSRQVELSPLVFLGQERAHVRELEPPIAGTRIRFSRASNIDALTTALREAAEFYPIDVVLNGKPVPRHDFLDGALHREVIDGIEVGFARHFTHGFGNYWGDKNWNFYGVRIEQSALKISGVLLQDRLFPETIYARFSVLDTGRVKLQLPDRKAIIEDEFSKQFHQKARAAAYRFIQTLEHHVLPYQNWREASELGIALPEASCLLLTWHAKPQDDSTDQFFGLSESQLLADTSNVILVDRTLPNAHTFEAALECGATLDGKLYMEEPHFQGYSWYDMRPRIVDAEVFVDDVSYEDWSANAGRPDRIEVEVTLKEAHGERQVRLPALIHVDSEETIDNGRYFVAVKNSPWDNEQLAGPFSVIDLIINATFCASDDAEADSWETQYDNYAEDVRRDVNQYFRGPRATLMAILRGAIDYAADQLAKEIGVQQIRFTRPANGSRAWRVELFESNDHTPN